MYNVSRNKTRIFRSHHGRNPTGPFISGQHQSIHSTLYESDPSTYLDTLISQREMPQLNQMSPTPKKSNF